MVFHSTKTFNYGMFAILKIHNYILLEQSKKTYNMNLFKNCNLNKKFTTYKRCVLEYAILYNNYDMVKILLEHNCNVIDNESFIYSIISFLNSTNIQLKKISFDIFKLILFSLKNQEIEKTKIIIKNGLEVILKEKNHYPQLLKYIIYYYPNILQYVSIYYNSIKVNFDNIYLIQYPIVCLKFNRFKFKKYNNIIQQKIKLYLLIMNRINKLPPEICEFILEFVQLDKLKLKS